MLQVVLFEPEIPANTGNVIRLCANTGAVLHLVQPLGFRMDDKSLRRSGLDYHDLTSVSVHADLESCLQALGESRVLVVETGSRTSYAAVEYREDDAFLFGPETRGLPTAALDRIGIDNAIAIPMQATSRSLNLSNAVAVVIFEAWRQLEFAGSFGF